MVCAGLGIPPSQIVFVDDQSRNITGAKASGMLAVKFDINTPRACFNQALTLLGIPTLDESVA
jgi:putative hydrolase of the HAD superfamily